jgi:phosphoglycerate dehydrogenase-like enzyme
MVRVGVPDWSEEELLAKFSRQVELVRIPAAPDNEIPIDFWIPPLYPKAAQKVFPHLAGVKVAQSLLAGVDWLLRLLPDDITVCDAQGVHNVATAEWVVAAVLATLKNFPFYTQLQLAGNWVRRREADLTYRSMHHIDKVLNPPALVEEVEGKTILIVGYGSIGHSIEQRLAPFGVNFLRVARRERPGIEPVSRLRDLLPLADVVILILPLTAETTGMIGATELALLKQGALLVNAARGPVVDTGALLAALHAGKIRATVDVADPEPLPEDHPMWRAPNLFITPHVAGSSPLFMVRAYSFAAEQVARYIAGKPLLNIVSGDY